jgi:hypothetical protein
MCGSRGSLGGESSTSTSATIRVRPIQPDAHSHCDHLQPGSPLLMLISISRLPSARRRPRRRRRPSADGVIVATSAGPGVTTVYPSMTPRAPASSVPSAADSSDADHPGGDSRASADPRSPSVGASRWIGVLGPVTELVREPPARWAGPARLAANLAAELPSASTFASVVTAARHGARRWVSRCVASRLVWWWSARRCPAPCRSSRPRTPPHRRDEVDLNAIVMPESLPQLWKVPPPRTGTGAFALFGGSALPVAG